MGTIMVSGDRSISTESAIQLFVEQMNIKAEELGANNSNFVGPDGYDAKNQYYLCNLYSANLIYLVFSNPSIFHPPVILVVLLL